MPRERTRDPQIGFGDLVHASRHLAPRNDATRRRIAVLLGLTSASPRSPLAPPPEPALPKPTLPSEKRRTTPRPTPAPPVESTAPSAVRFEPRTEAAAEGEPEEEAPAVDWLGQGEVLPKPHEAPPGPRPPIESLFAHRRARAILGALLATARRDGPVDVQRLVDLLARGRPIAAGLPRLLRPALHLGAQVLFDHGPAMNPFARDLAALAEQVRSVVGRDRCRLYWFEGLPSRGVGADGELAWRPWRPPAPGTPVLVVSDLNIARVQDGPPVEEEDWLAFAEDVGDAGCPLLALVPYPRARWPTRLRWAIPILGWDRRTTAADAVHRRRREVGWA